MKVESIVVEIHEKRNHPNAYGHYDARVAYTATVEEGEDPATVVATLQAQARQHAVGECDRWIAEIHLEEERGRARNNLDRAVRRAKTKPSTPEEMAQFEMDLSPLVASEQSEYRAKLLAAQDEYLTDLQNELAGHISAASKGLLSPHGKERFYQDVERLPEGERGDLRQRMVDAVASRVADPVAGADNDNDDWAKDNDVLSAFSGQSIVEGDPGDDFGDDDDEEIPL